jgi:hypothetical protein
MKDGRSHMLSRSGAEAPEHIVGLERCKLSARLVWPYS